MVLRWQRPLSEPIQEQAGFSLLGLLICEEKPLAGGMFLSIKNIPVIGLRKFAAIWRAFRPLQINRCIHILCALSLCGRRRDVSTPLPYCPCRDCRGAGAGRR